MSKLDITLEPVPIAPQPSEIAAPTVTGPPASGPMVEPFAGAGSAIAGAPGIVTPGAAVRTNRFPLTVARMDTATINPGDNLLPDSFRPPAPGTLRWAGAVTNGSTWTLSVDGGVTWLTLNGGTNLPAGAWTETTVTCVPGDQIQISLSASDTVQGFRAVWVPDMV